MYIFCVICHLVSTNPQLSFLLCHPPGLSYLFFLLWDEEYKEYEYLYINALLEGLQFNPSSFLYSIIFLFIIQVYSLCTIYLTTIGTLAILFNGAILFLYVSVKKVKYLTIGICKITIFKIYSWEQISTFFYWVW